MKTDQWWGTWGVEISNLSFLSQFWNQLKNHETQDIASREAEIRRSGDCMVRQCRPPEAASAGQPACTGVGLESALSAGRALYASRDS